MNLDPNVIHVYRGSFIESSHYVNIAVVTSEGKLTFSYGDPFRATFPRSALKPFQAVPLIESGAANAFSFDQADISLCCASHSGEEIHRSRVLSLLKQIGKTENVLQCGTHIPRDQVSYERLVRGGKELTPVFSNCSGKHTGMIATCLHLHENMETYRDVNHPLQQRILDVISSILNYKKEDIKISTDGCSLPTHQLPLYNVALGFSRLSRPDQMNSSSHANALETIKDSMMSYPEMVAGSNRFDTDLMKAFNKKIVSKMGAEGVQCIGLVESGIGIAIKVEDGNNRAASVAAMEVLKQLGIGNEDIYKELQAHVEPTIKNMSGESVGKIIADFHLHEA